jgi:hypothetical protein
LIQWILGAKGWKSGASLFAGGFLNLGPAKNMSKKPLFEEKIRGLGMFLELRECKARSNSVSSGTVIKKIRASDE